MAIDQHQAAKKALLQQYQEIVTKYMTNVHATLDVEHDYHLTNPLGFNYFVDYLFLANVCYQASLDVLNNENNKYPEIHELLAQVIVKYPEFMNMAVFNADFQDERITDQYEATIVNLAHTLD